MIDTLALARDAFPGKRNNLDALCERFGVSNAHRTLHGALLDAQLLAEVYLAMTRGQESLTIDMGAAPGASRRSRSPACAEGRPALVVLLPTPRGARRARRPISRRWTASRGAAACGSRRGELRPEPCAA